VKKEGTKIVGVSTNQTIRKEDKSKVRHWFKKWEERGRRLTGEMVEPILDKGRKTR
jgi:hypothetical protein